MFWKETTTTTNNNNTLYYLPGAFTTTRESLKSVGPLCRRGEGDLSFVVAMKTISMTVAAIKSELKRRHLPTDGTKKVLAARLDDAVSKEEEEKEKDGGPTAAKAGKRKTKATAKNEETSNMKHYRQHYPMKVSKAVTMALAKARARHRREAAASRRAAAGSETATVATMMATAETMQATAETMKAVAETLYMVLDKVIVR